MTANAPAFVVSGHYVRGPSRPEGSGYKEIVLQLPNEKKAQMTADNLNSLLDQARQSGLRQVGWMLVDLDGNPITEDGDFVARPEPALCSENTTWLPIYIAR